VEGVKTGGIGQHGRPDDHVYIDFERPDGRRLDHVVQVEWLNYGAQRLRPHGCCEDTGQVAVNKPMVPS